MVFTSEGRPLCSCHRGLSAVLIAVTGACVPQEYRFQAGFDIGKGTKYSEYADQHRHRGCQP